jgi:anti-anti-sigma factor
MSLARVTFAHHDGVPVAALDGDVDAANARRVIEEVLAPLDNRTEGLVLDLTAARYLDSAGLNVLFELHDLLSARRQGFSILVAPAARLNRVLDISGVRATVPVCERLEDALAAVRG